MCRRRKLPRELRKINKRRRHTFLAVYASFFMLFFILRFIYKSAIILLLYIKKIQRF